MAYCTICTMQFIPDEEETIATKCGHLYHEKCLITWFHKSEE